MMQAIASLASLLLLVAACKVMLSNIMDELPTLRALLRPRVQPALAPLQFRALSARRAAMIRVVPPTSHRAAA